MAGLPAISRAMTKRRASSRSLREATGRCPVSKRSHSRKTWNSPSRSRTRQWPARSPSVAPGGSSRWRSASMYSGERALKGRRGRSVIQALLANRFRPNTTKSCAGGTLRFWDHFYISRSVIVNKVHWLYSCPCSWREVHFSHERERGDRPAAERPPGRRAVARPVEPGDRAAVGLDAQLREPPVRRGDRAEGGAHPLD